jgi:hypothetical protein
MAVHDSLSSTFTGRVTSVNDRGLKLDGHDDWYNVSKFAPPITLPSRGDSVTICVDSKGFLRSCFPADGAPQQPATRAERAVQPDTTRERTITRLAVLKAAAEFSSSKPSSSSADVLKIAACWEAWVTRSDAPEPNDIVVFDAEPDDAL